ncbi:MAG: flagellar biosynthesis protein FlgI [Maricaulis sp.]|nr:flagellar biosynthesis protein FlgI [Maricaulis sp.]
MKIQGPSSTSSASAAKRKTTSGASGNGFQVETGSQASGSAPMSGASAVSSVQSVDAILALQGVEDATQAKKKATERAMSLLDVLDELKIGLLEGGLPRSKLVALMNLLQTRRDQTHDAQLEAALDEVETRAAVELAKFS